MSIKNIYSVSLFCLLLKTSLLLFQLSYDAAPSPLSPLCKLLSLKSSQPLFLFPFQGTHTYLGDDTPASYSTLSNVDPAPCLPHNRQRQTSKQLGREGRKGVGSLRSVLRGAPLIASLSPAALFPPACLPTCIWGSHQCLCVGYLLQMKAASVTAFVMIRLLRAKLKVGQS